MKRLLNCYSERRNPIAESECADRKPGRVLLTATGMCLLLLSATGCEAISHELQPHRLWRLNYQESPGRTDGVYFSVPDPLESQTAEIATPGSGQ